jgi:ribosomal protein S18 acetylase RimI-like enzyme
LAEFRIRGFRVRDTSRIWEIARISFADDISLLGLGPGQIWRKFLPYGLLYALQRISRKPRFKFFVAEVKEKAVGGTMIQWESDFAYIAAVMVHPEFRRQGIGRALVSEAVKVAFGYGAKKAVLHVREDNLPAKNLYLSLGFQAFETRVNLLREASPLPQEKPLPPRFQIVKTAPWEERAREALRASRSPKALEVYGFPNPPRGIARLFSSPRKVFVLLRDGKALGLMSLYPGKVLQLRAHLAQEGVSEAAAQAFLLRGLRAAPGRKALLRADLESVNLIEAAKNLGFQEIGRELGMVLWRT